MDNTLGHNFTHLLYFTMTLLRSPHLLSVSLIFSVREVTPLLILITDFPDLSNNIVTHVIWLTLYFHFARCNLCISLYTVMHPDLCRTVTIEQLLPLKEEIGNCWMDLGFALDLSEARVSNIRDDCNSNKERGYAVLMAWMEQHGKNATMGRLAVVLDGIGRKDIVDSLFGMSSYQCVYQALG